MTSAAQPHPGALNRLPARAAAWLVRLYQWGISPAIHAIAGPGHGCRFQPTCSCYAIEALERHGLATGGFMAARRILRCHPWNKGGFDPVPPGPAA